MTSSQSLTASSAVPSEIRPIRRADLLLGQLAARDRAPGGVGEVALGALEARVVVLDADDVDPGAREHLGDARSHRAQSDDTDPAERHARLLWMCFAPVSQNSVGTLDSRPFSAS